MLIYSVPNAAERNYYYVCDSQTTIDARTKNAEGQYIIPENLCSIGTEADANTILTNNQKAWLIQQASLFTCNLQNVVEGGVVWTVVDLTAEPENTDRQYFVIDPTDGLYEPAIGLDAAKLLLASIQQEYLIFTNMNACITETAWI